MTVPDSGEPSVTLSGAIRARLVALAAESVGRVENDLLPSPLRRVAGFAPVQRARLGGEQILGMAARDAGFRALLARDVREHLADDPEPRDAAVLAWLERPAGWEDVVGSSTAEDAAREEENRLRQATDSAQRAQRRLDAATEELREARQRAREDLDGQRRENTDLRRKLGEARQVARRALEDAEDLRRTTDQAAASARAERTALDSEARRLRQRVSDLEQRLARAQRVVRADRDETSLRARLLLDSVIDAASGLRRELALPAVEGLPADRVLAEEADPGHRVSSGAGSLRRDDPALLDQLLGLPRTHLLVDGYNVTKTAWPDASLEVQRERLVSGLAGLHARTGIEVTAVFDAAETSGPRPVVHAPRGVRVRFSPTGVIADDVIRDFVGAEPEGRPVVVVTSDRAVVRDVVRRRGVRAVDALALVRLLAR